jgi:hydroxypyruvate isomerase
MRRRELGALVTAGIAVRALAQSPDGPVPRKGRLKQSVTAGVFGRSMPFESTCREAARLGCKGYDLVGPADWPTLKKYGLVPAMYPLGPGGTIQDALNRRENHERLDKSLRAAIDESAANFVPNVITFSGLRRGMDDREGADNCVGFLNNIKAHAEDKGVTVCMEYLNSKVNHKDYMCDHSSWGMQLVDRVGSERFKLLYDIYHMQIMEGDVIRTIQDRSAYFAHFHTGGVPGRHEIDATQELNYPAIARAIKATGFRGYVAQEFIPVRDPLTSLAEAVGICTV